MYTQYIICSPQWHCACHDDSYAHAHAYNYAHPKTSPSHIVVKNRVRALPYSLQAGKRLILSEQYCAKQEKWGLYFCVQLFSCRPLSTNRSLPGRAALHPRHASPFLPTQPHTVPKLRPPPCRTSSTSISFAAMGLIHTPPGKLTPAVSFDRTTLHDT